ncbi:hypothetical protein A8C56_05445 [Niabella ginsenosidivorans]|uniref:HTH araC/xylS-type domain-containing protein n=1 Tax=Niabella ginsenosidivorans TaxID=1176587 RepID=A0A1A9HYL2_9BACT|nr:AraC family transcriptional regulator [Niabella ginsenosidivorans]ANH80508.1 hypothetical protein A8C56_05445 [Niabella ginsenosidivorans]
MRKKTKNYAPVKGTSIQSGKGIYVSYLELGNGSDWETGADNLFALVLFQKGNGTHSINAEDYTIKAKQIHILYPGQKQQWKLQPPVKGQWLTIKRALLETFPAALQFPFSEHNAHPVLNLDITAYQKISAEFLAIKKELSTATIFLELVNARCRLICLMINLWMEHQFGNTPPSCSGSASYKFHSLVEKHFTTQKSVAFYARHLHITPNYLGIICRKQYGMSALEFIQERVLLEAKRLLHSSGMSIKEIAFHLGFPNPAYFGYFFKKKTSLTPKEYKILLNKS